MEIKGNILPRLNEEILRKEEKTWRVKLPIDYREFLLDTNGAIPHKKEFKSNNRKYMIVSFVCIADTEHHEKGYYVVWNR